VTPADEVTSVSDQHGQWQDEMMALSSSLMTDVQGESGVVDDKTENNVLCDLISGHMNDLDSRMIGDADDVCGLQVDDTEPQIFHNQSHKLIHSDLILHKCDMCQKAFSTKSNLSKDKLSVDRRLCDICTEACVTSTDLTRCRQNHAADKPHEYEVCEKQATRDINEVDDRLSGGGEKVVSEHVVDDTEAENSWDEAADNTVTHNNPAADTSHATNTHPYVCDICTKSFTTAGIFEIHRQTRHSHRRLYKCDVCPKRYVYSGCLRNHMLKHTEDSADKTKVCQKRFCSPKRLKSHSVARRTRGRNSYKCEVCPKICSTLCGLKKHKHAHYRHHVYSVGLSAPDRLKSHMLLHAMPPRQCHSSSNDVNTGSAAPAVKQVSNFFSNSFCHMML